jgi:hypothetical protein
VRSPRERGQVLPLVVALLAVAVAVTLVVVELGVAAVQRARARTAADAAALAGAAEGEAAARALARDNGAELVVFEADGLVVHVEVTLGDARASASAESIPDLPAGIPPGTSPAVAAALARAAQLLGRPVPVAAVLDAGSVVEVDPETAGELSAVAVGAGLCRLSAPARPVHFAVCPPSPPG